MNGTSSPVQTESLLLSLFMLLYPLLHATVTIRAWDTPALPQDWPLNLGIALLVGIAGILLLGAAWRMAQRAYGFSWSLIGPARLDSERTHAR